MSIKLSNEKYTLKTEKLLENKPGHLYTITFTDISKNDVIASGSWDGTVRLWTETEQIEVIFFLKEPIEGLKFSPNGKYLAVGIENEIHIYDMSTKQSFRILPKDPAMRGAVFAWSSDSSKLACILYDHTIRVYDTLEQREIGVIEDIPSLGGNYISWKDDLLAIGLNNSSIVIYNLNSAVFQLVATLESHSDVINAVTFIESEDNLILYSVSADNTIRAWDLKNNKSKLIYSHNQPLINITTRHTLAGHLVIACSENENIIFLEDTFQYIITLDNSSYCNIAISANADKFLRGINEHDLAIYSFSEKKLIRTLKGKYDHINSVKLFNNQQILYASSDKSIHLVNFLTKEEYLFIGHTESISDVAISKDKKIIVSASYDDSIRLWDAITKKEKTKLVKSAELPSCVTFNNDDSLIYCASGGDFTLRSYNLTGKLNFSGSMHEEYINKIISYKKGFFTIGDDKKVVFWENNKGQILAKSDSEILSIAVSSNHDLLAFGSASGLLKIIEIVNGKKKLELKFNKKIYCCAFSPDDNLIAIGIHTKLFIYDFTTQETNLIYNFSEQLEEFFWLKNESNENFLSNLICISVSRELISCKIFLTESIKIEEKKNIPEVINQEIETVKENILPIEKEISQINQDQLKEKFVEEVESMINSEKEIVISDFSSNVTKNISPLELGSLVYKEYIETLKHLDKIQELIRMNSDEFHDGFQIILNRVNRLKPVINEALDEIDFILD
jgi:WD40 repeat protein